MAFDPQTFISGSAATQLPSTSPTEDPAPMPTTGAATAVAAKAPPGFDPNRFIHGGKATDQLTGEEIPLAYSGNSPDTAMNKSPLSATDRMKLSFGNTAGNINYLKEHFADAKPIMGEDGKPSQELAVRDGNTWYRVNPKNGDIADPWEKTKEYIKDAASLAPEALGIGTAVVADVATAGSSLAASGAIAGASTAALRTSLGRIVGTYDASPAEQAWDIGFESLLNAAGGKILAGVKPTAKVIANKLGLLAEAFKDTVEPLAPGAYKAASDIMESAGSAMAGAPKAMFKKIFASYSVGENNFDKMAEQPDAVSGTMRRLADMSGTDVQSYHDQAVREQVDQIGKIAGDTRQVLSDIYGSMRNKLLAKVGPGFKVNLEDSVYSAYKDALEKGIGVLKVGSKELQGKDAIEFLAQNGTQKASFRTLSQDELQRSIAQGSSLAEGRGYLSANKDAYDTLSQFYSQLDKFAGGADRTGAKGAADLLDFKKVATDLANKATGGEALQGAYDVRKVITSAKAAIDDNVFQALKAHGADKDFLNMNQTYDKLSTGFAPLLNAQKRAIAAGDTKAYEGLLSTFLARPKPSASARFAIDDAITAAQSNGLTAQAAKLAAQKNQIQVLEAAKAFNPIKPGVLKAVDIGGGAIGVYALTSQNPALLAAMIGMKAVSSPTGAKTAIATVQGLSKGQEFLSNLTKTQLNAFMSSPEAINAFTTGVTQAPLVRMKADQAMQGALQQAIGQPAQ